jgi:hypothetical protein
LNVFRKAPRSAAVFLDSVVFGGLIGRPLLGFGFDAAKELYGPSYLHLFPSYLLFREMISGHSFSNVWEPAGRSTYQRV